MERQQWHRVVGLLHCYHYKTIFSSEFRNAIMQVKTKVDNF